MGIEGNSFLRPFVENVKTIAGFLKFLMIFESVFRGYLVVDSDGSSRFPRVGSP